MAQRKTQSGDGKSSSTSPAKPLTKDEARRIAANVAKLHHRCVQVGYFPQLADNQIKTERMIAVTIGK
jgi:hypothetical protein